MFTLNRIDAGKNGWCGITNNIVDGKFDKTEVLYTIQLIVVKIFQLIVIEFFYMSYKGHHKGCDFSDDQALLNHKYRYSQ